MCWLSQRVFIYTSGAILDLSSLWIDCLRLYWFHEREIHLLCDLLRLDTNIISRTMLKANNWETLCIMLNKFKTVSLCSILKAQFFFDKPNSSVGNFSISHSKRFIILFSFQFEFELFKNLSLNKVFSATEEVPRQSSLKFCNSLSYFLLMLSTCLWASC